MLADAGIEKAGNKLLTVFLADAEKRMSALRAATAAGDGKAMGRAAHGMKSGAGNVCADRLAGILTTLEERADGGDVPGAAALLPDLEREYARVTLEIQRELALGASR